MGSYPPIPAELPVIAQRTYNQHLFDHEQFGQVRPHDSRHHSHAQNREPMSHSSCCVERNLWKRIEEDTDLHVGKARIGERITNLYLDGLIQNKDGYALTKKGREQLAFAAWKNEGAEAK